MRLHHPHLLLLLLFLVSSSLLNGVSPLRDIPQSSCSSELHEHNPVVNSSGMHLTLHHPRSPCSPASLHHLSFAEVLHHDVLRVAAVSSRLTSTSPHRHHHRSSSLSGDHPSLVSSPLSPGASFGVSNYITKLGVGSPAVYFPMVVDTGSSLTWLQCSPCRVSCHAQSVPFFDPSKSSTYRSVPCSAAACDSLQSATLNPSACSARGVCIYEASYGDSSFSVGYLSQDTVTFGTSSRPGFIFGCGEDNQGLFGRSAGLIGLARNKLSLLSQFSSSLGYSFSYCLPTIASTGFLSIGGNSGGELSAYTPLLTSSLDNSLYFVKLTGIKVNGKEVGVSASAYSDIPTIIDSGTVITRLPSGSYYALSSAVSHALSKVPKAPSFSILDTCFKGKAEQIAAPVVSLVFEGNAELKLPTRNVLIDVDDGQTCLAFAPATRVAIIGNRQQQTFKVAYDVAKSRLGFSAGGCG